MRGPEGSTTYQGIGVDADEFMSYLDAPQEGAPALAQAMGHADPGAGQGGLPALSESGGELTEDQKLLEQLKGIQRQTATAIKALENKIAGGK